jgi:hypothetical protein
MNVRRWPIPTLGCLVLLCQAAVPARADDPGIARKHHPWGRFQPGAWRSLHVVTETLDERGLVVHTSTSDKRTFLTKVDSDGVTLDVQSTVEVAGKRFETEPETQRQTFHGEPVGVAVKFEPGETEAVNVEIDGRKVPCRKWTFSYTTGNNGQKTTGALYFSETLAPYVLQRRTTTNDAEGAAAIAETGFETKALEIPWRATGEIKTAAIIKTTAVHAKGTTVTWSIISYDVPGGLLAESTKELDKNGRLARRSTAELVDHGLECEEERIGPFRIRRRPRLRG